MSDFEMLKTLQQELVTTLEARKISEHVTHDVSRAKIHRLRLQISEIMLRIERKCTSYFTMDDEEWH